MDSKLEQQIGRLRRLAREGRVSTAQVANYLDHFDRPWRRSPVRFLRLEDIFEAALGQSGEAPRTK
ncbi:MAG: hypothetical protein UY92_C0004G0088 [Candidatus Magasanikbacteria bacterium GW2011_GWA2_56_11]|uniref:Uncharacterized protein n=1 Tax=Candidatus Magasanikbacteria bacterium GW2011_GWA2_56_11 TaxID=1619044 RepID=A0A0G2AN39_9BACT|nr:MAG: hypothetical protein UY92_C0004G0088 [Candidatus Magasanikbacteria bacterium GW2011_GWA2_56_11]